VTTTYLAYIPSPSQGVWHLSFIPIRAYALFIVAGIVVALMLGDRRWVARGGQAGVIYDIALLVVPFGLIGGRLYHVITDWRTYFGDDGAGLLGAFRIWDGGLGIWGAVALGGVGAWIGCRYKGIPLPAFGDAIAPGIILAQAIGRVGNYFNQELFGRPTTLPWGLEIYERLNANGAHDNLNGVSTGQLEQVVHPTFLYELLWNLLVFAVLIYLDRRFKIGHGRLFAIYVAAYCLGRFWIELMRSDAAYMPVDGIRVNTFTSTFVFIAAVVYIMVAPKGREDPASLAGKPEAVEDTVETFAKELTAVAATTGVVAAAKAAGDAEDEDAKDAADDEKPEAPDEPEVKGAEALSPDVADVPAESVEEAEEFAAEGEAEPEAGLGEVEGEEAVEALAAAPEAHEAAVEAAEQAEAIADEVAAEAEAEEPEAEAEEPEAETEDTTDEQPEAESAEQPEAETSEPEAGLGAVEGEEAVEALEAAPDVHDAAVAAADEAEAVADEVVAEEEPSSEAAAEAEALTEDVAEAPSEDIAEAEEFAEAGEEAEQAEAAAKSEASEPDEPETEDAEAAVEEVEAEPSEEEAAEEAEAVVEEADSAAEDEPTTGVLEAKTEPEKTPEPAAPTEQTGGRLRRWLRRDR
jgi:phosphatidylglycerol---prolipoprotein diacylglyceryl transferase